MIGFDYRLQPLLAARARVVGESKGYFWERELTIGWILKRKISKVYYYDEILLNIDTVTELVLQR